MTGKNALDYHEPDRFLQMQLQAAWLYYIKDLTQQEIATRLGISRGKSDAAHPAGSLQRLGKHLY